MILMLLICFYSQSCLPLQEFKDMSISSYTIYYGQTKMLNMFHYRDHTEILLRTPASRPFLIAMVKA